MKRNRSSEITLPEPSDRLEYYALWVKAVPKSQLATRWIRQTLDFQAKTQDEDLGWLPCGCKAKRLPSPTHFSVSSNDDLLHAIRFPEWVGSVDVFVGQWVFLDRWALPLDKTLVFDPPFPMRACHFHCMHVCLHRIPDSLMRTATESVARTLAERRLARAVTNVRDVSIDDKFVPRHIALDNDAWIQTTKKCEISLKTSSLDITRYLQLTRTGFWFERPRRRPSDPVVMCLAKFGHFALQIQSNTPPNESGGSTTS